MTEKRYLGPLRFSLLAVLTGVVAGLGAVVFRSLIAFFHNLLFLGKSSLVYDANVHTPPGPWGPFVVLVPVAGALGVAFLVKNFAPEAKGHGVPEVMDAIYYHKGVIRPVVAVVKSLASALSIGSGGSVGREGPIVQIGSSFGSSLGQVLSVPVWQRITLIAAGAGGGIAATFNTPVGGVLFALEIMMHEVSARTLIPVVMATATATYVGRICFGPHPSFVIPAFETPYFHLTAPLVLMAYVGLGLLMGVVAAVFIKAIYGTEDFFAQRIGGGYYRQHVTGMLLVGIILYLLMITSGHYYVEGVGYATVQDVLSGAPSHLYLLLLLFALKLLVTSLTLGSGASGGIFSPALFMGATLGGAYGSLLGQLFPGLGISPPAFAVAGMAALVGGATGAAVTAIVMIFEMTLDYNVIIPITVTVALSYGVRRMLSRESIYTLKLARRGHYIPEALQRPLSSSPVDLRIGPTVRRAHDDTAGETALSLKKESPRRLNMRRNPLKQLQTYGQSVWLDFIRRGMLVSGELAPMIEEDGLRGVTSNPSIFEKAIAGSQDYDAAIRALALEGKDAAAIYRTLAVADVQLAADLFRPIYDKTGGADGYVSLEVDPHLAHDAEGTVAEARRLWAALDRPNVMIKVPGTREGLPAIRRLVSEGINVNVTLLFGLPRYRAVAGAYLAGLQDRLAQGLPLDRVASVASFFLSRIDVLVDPMLERAMNAGGPRADVASRLQGQVAIASARAAYQVYREVFCGARFRTLAEQGARPQRLLWASTSTKDPRYSDVKYVETLIGPETVNTMPLATLNAYRDHGHPAPRLEEGMDEAIHTLARLADAGIDLDQVTQQLEDEGLDKFAKPYDTLISTLEKARVAALAAKPDQQVMDLDAAAQAAVRKRLAVLEAKQFGARLWRKDASLWKTDPAAQKTIANALGWLHVAEQMEEHLAALLGVAAGVRAAGFRHVVHMGMGGSSLAPLAFQRTFPVGEHGLPLTVLDTTDPVTILHIERQVPLRDTLFIVASKSGTTAEPLAFGDYFYHKLRERKGERAGDNFVAITDPSTPLEDLARRRSFRHTFLNFSDIGGRYSALSYFGLVPAALMGLDVGEILARALRMEHACTSSVPAAENPGLVLGAVMGELASQGRDKVTFLVPADIATLGMWLEQLLAESTGKEGHGLLPVAGEPVGAPEVYGPDRLFVYYRLHAKADDRLAHRVADLRASGQPVVTITLDDPMHLAQEFFRWEMATATAGALLGINAFDQPNVQESKDNTNRLLDVVRKEGHLPEEQPALVEGALSLYVEEAAPTIPATMKQFLSQALPGDYFAIQAYLTETPETEAALQALRLAVRDRLKIATTLGYGPRFLHSTGQYHKGGPNTGLFLQLTADDAEDAAVPGEPFTFGMFKRAQAAGDLEALRRHGQRVLRIHLGTDVRQGLAALQAVVEQA